MQTGNLVKCLVNLPPIPLVAKQRDVYPRPLPIYSVLWRISGSAFSPQSTNQSHEACLGSTLSYNGRSYTQGMSQDSADDTDWGRVIQKIALRRWKIVIIPKVVVVFNDDPHHIQQRPPLQLCRKAADIFPCDLLVEGSSHSPPSHAPASSF